MAFHEMSVANEMLFAHEEQQAFEETAGARTVAVMLDIAFDLMRQKTPGDIIETRGGVEQVERQIGSHYASKLEELTEQEKQ